MEDFNELYKKAGVLMQDALKKYAAGDVEGGDKSRHEANQFYDQAEAYVNKDSNNISQLYGESRNFGIIYNVIEGNSKNLFEDKTKRKAFRNIVKMIKENKTLKTQFDFFNCLTHPQNVFSTEQYVNEALAIAPKMNVNEVIKANEQLISEVRNNKLDELIDIDDDTMALYESIEYLLFNKPSFANLSEYSNAKNNVVVYLNENIEKENEKVVAENKNLDETLSAIIEKYDSLLNNEEKELIENVMGSEDKKTLFENYRDNTVKKIEIALNESDSKELREICENIKNKTYNRQTVLEDIAEFVEITDVLS